MGTQSLSLITEDGVELRWGQIVDGETLVRNGALVESEPAAAPSSGANSGTATLAFGSTPAIETTVVITGQSWVAADSEIHAYVMATSTASNGTDDHLQAGVFMRFVVGDLVVGTGFTIYAYVINGYVTGDFTICWEGS